MVLYQVGQSGGVGSNQAYASMRMLPTPVVDSNHLCAAPLWFAPTSTFVCSGSKEQVLI